MVSPAWRMNSIEFVSDDVMATLSNTSFPGNSLKGILLWSIFDT